MTMTPEQIAQSRAICNAATPGPLIICGDYVRNPETNLNFAIMYRHADAAFIAHARTALPVALDALDEADRKIKAALKTCPNGGNDGYITPRPCQCEVESIEADRDHWKDRADVLEKERDNLAQQLAYCMTRVDELIALTSNLTPTTSLPPHDKTERTCRG